MQNTNIRRSLGALRKAPKTKEKSPDLQGTIKVQRHTIDAIIKQFEDTDEDEIISCLAGWFNDDSKGRFVSVELSPRYVSRQKIPRRDPVDMFDAFFQDKEEFSELK